MIPRLTKRAPKDVDAQPRAKRARPSTFPLVLDGLREFEGDFLHYVPSVFGDVWSRALLRDLKKLHAFKQDPITVFGRVCLIPRKQVLLARGGGTTYRYSGIDMQSDAWSDVVDVMCRKLETQFGVPLNSCLANWYRDGHDNVARHSDDEDDMEHDVIITVSLGATRTLRVTNKQTGEKLLQVALRNGSVFVQKAGMQKVRRHEIPKELRVKEERISLTFRQLRLTAAAAT
jgi:alkylated DNA repair dioxygenase AlkB